MSHRVRIRIAAAVTALFLAGLSAAGLAVQDHPPRASVPVSSTAAPAAVAVPSVADDDEHSEEAEHDE